MTEEEKLDAERRAGDFKIMARTLFALCVVTLVVIPMASHSTDGQLWFMATGLSYAIFLASSLLGGFVGFIFSVPHPNKVTTVEQATDPDAISDTGSSKPNLVQHQPLLRSNSSLERISEWLTTMLVGVGLSQLNSIPTGLRAFGEFLKPLDSVKSGGVDVVVGSLQYVGPTILVAGLFAGFLSVYLHTRLRITYLFVDAEQELNKRTGEDARLTVGETRALTTIAETSTLTENASVKAMTSAHSTSVRDALAVMTQLLYDVKGHGYRRVIDMGRELLSTPAVSVTRYWFLMAAAYGQEYTYEKNEGASDVDLKKIKANVLNAIDRTLALNPKYKRTFFDMLDPTHVDNDLKSFADHEDVVSRLR